MSFFPHNIRNADENSHDARDPEGHDPEVREVQAPKRRIPNFGHAALFVSFAGLVLCLIELLTYALGKFPVSVQGGATTVLHPKLQIATLATTYFISLLAAWFVYPRLWNRTLLDGLSWNWSAARNQAIRLVALGVMLGTMMQFVTYFITPPKSPMPIDEFFSTPLDAWLITLFGTFAAPVFEEICFRGFLVPAFAIAYDWLSLPRTEEARMRWQTTTNLSPDSLLFSAILTSALFAWMHAPQVSHLWAALLGLFSISLVLTLIRVKTQSVAASAMVHAAYNGFVFVMAIIQTGGYRHLDRMMH